MGAKLGSNICRSNPWPQVLGHLRLPGRRVSTSKQVPRDKSSGPNAGSCSWQAANTTTGEMGKDCILDCEASVHNIWKAVDYIRAPARKRLFKSKKHTSIHMMGYYLALKRNVLSGPEKTLRNLKCTLLSERNQSK